MAVSRAHHLAGAVHLHKVTGSSASWERRAGQERAWESGIPPAGCWFGVLPSLPSCM